MSILPELPYSCKEKSGGFLIAWMLLMLSQADESIHLFFSEPMVRENIAFILGFLGLMLLLPVFIAGYQFLVWKKTWIYLEEQTLVIERNTLRRKKNTYNPAHISNINTEQNLFELMIHYGFFRKQDYTIPINRIHALRILEPPIARLTGRCEVQLVCIGVGDSKEELTQLSLCRKKPPFLLIYRNFYRNFLRPYYIICKGRPNMPAKFISVPACSGFCCAACFPAGQYPAFICPKKLSPMDTFSIYSGNKIPYPDIIICFTVRFLFWPLR